MAASPITIVFALFPGVTQLDFTGPHQVLSPAAGRRGAPGEPRPASRSRPTASTFAGLRRLADIERCDIICVPGGFGATDSAIADEAFLRELRRLAAGARYVTSVCTGSLVLGAAGLLRGKRAACHWAWRDLLPAFGAIPDAGARGARRQRHHRRRRDRRHRFRADPGGRDRRRRDRAGDPARIEYAPAPPFDAGRPETAPPEVLARVNERYAAGAAQRRAAVEAAAARMHAAGF